MSSSSSRVDLHVTRQKQDSEVSKNGISGRIKDKSVTHSVTANDVPL